MKLFPAHGLRSLKSVEVGGFHVYKFTYIVRNELKLEAGIPPQTSLWLRKLGIRHSQVSQFKAHTHASFSE